VQPLVGEFRDSSLRALCNCPNDYLQTLKIS